MNADHFGEAAGKFDAPKSRFTEKPGGILCQIVTAVQAQESLSFKAIHQIDLQRDLDKYNILFQTTHYFPKRLFLQIDATPKLPI